MSLPKWMRQIWRNGGARELDELRQRVTRISALEAEYSALSDAALRARTADLRNTLDRGAGLDDVLERTFATVREVSKRVLDLRHHDVQLLGGLVLQRGAIAEMGTGEGKSLTATCPLYLHALAGRGAHLITVNEYLATRDAESLGRIFGFLGLSVGVLASGQSEQARRAAYACDITYGTPEQLGFDYLRDRMQDAPERELQRGLHYAIVDEVDSVLIDQARTPLLISAPDEDSIEVYHRIQLDALLRSLERGSDYTVDDRAGSANFTERGTARLEVRLGVANLHAAENHELLHHATQALHAHALYVRDVHYLVECDRVQIIDERTGRILPGRRWSAGLHQAIEAKENVTVHDEPLPRATITLQHLFRMYERLSGMTSTARLDAEEFFQLYALEVVAVPPHVPVVRTDQPDRVYRTHAAKLRAVVARIEECHLRGQPVLVGTRTLEQSEELSGCLARAGIAHQLLNAKSHAREAEFVSQAGRRGAVTIATNMAGRGTDIRLGGFPECAAERQVVVAAGGLHVIGTERHEARRIDDQLRGRAGRQGDPGSSQFYVALDDDLLRRLGSDRWRARVQRVTGPDDEPVHPLLVQGHVERAQRALEAQHFAWRKLVFEQDSVLHLQRATLYGLRAQIVGAREEPLALQRQRLSGIVDQVIDDLVRRTPDRAALAAAIEDLFCLSEALELPIKASAEPQLVASVARRIGARTQLLEREHGAPEFLALVWRSALQAIDREWTHHLLALESLRDGISLRAYAGADPRLAYQRESHALFQDMLTRLWREVIACQYRSAGAFGEVAVGAAEVQAVSAEWKLA